MKNQLNLFEAVDDKHVNMHGNPWQRTPWDDQGTTVWPTGIQPGDVVIVEDIHYDRDGKLQPSKYYRCICGQHATVSGILKHLTAEPDDEFPITPPWQLGWVYLGGYVNHRYWRRDKEARA